jgi:NADP-dependent aldehyde dehydrogenase
MMLTQGIASAFRQGRDRVAASTGVREILATSCDGRFGAPALYEVAARTWRENADLGEEVFGPLGIVVHAVDMAEMEEVARTLHGQLTATLHMEPADAGAARRLVPILERKAGRLIVNGFPTGVEVADSMVHGGPYPASTNFGHTSVGTLSIRRFLRPVCYQDMPAELLPVDLR